MKKIKIEKSLNLDKKVIAKLNDRETKSLKGGGGYTRGGSLHCRNTTCRCE